MYRDLPHRTRVIWSRVIFKPIVHALQECFCSLTRDCTPECYPFFGQKIHACIAIDVARLRVWSVGIAQGNSQVLRYQRCRPFHGQGALISQDHVATRGYCEGPACTALNNSIGVHPSDCPGNSPWGKAFSD
jgi:hypothetical protein